MIGSAAIRWNQQQTISYCVYKTCSPLKWKVKSVYQLNSRLKRSFWLVGLEDSLDVRVCQPIRSSVIGSIWCLQNQSNRSPTFVKGLCRYTISLFLNSNSTTRKCILYIDYVGRLIRVNLLPLVCLVMGDKMLVRLPSPEISNKQPLRSLRTDFWHELDPSLQLEE